MQPLRRKNFRKTSACGGLGCPEKKARPVMKCVFWVRAWGRRVENPVPARYLMQNTGYEMKRPIKTVRLYEELKELITSNRLRPGEKLPRETELAAGHGVSRVTVRAALEKLESEQLIRRVCGHGTFVQAIPQTDISILVPCADWIFQTRLSGILASHLVSGVMAACSKYNCRLSAIEFSPTNSPDDVNWRNLASLGPESRVIVFGFWYKNAFEFLRDCGCRVLLATPDRNWRLEFNAENYPDIPIFQKHPPQNWSFLTPDLADAARRATEYLIRERKCRRPAAALYNYPLLKRPGLLDGYREALPLNMDEIVISVDNLRTPEKLGEMQRRLGFDGVLLDLQRFGAGLSTYGLPEDFPAVRYSSVIEDRAPCILDDYQLVGDMAVRMLLEPPVLERKYPLEIKFD